ncbi:hypothetical protein I8752_09590 [Nostocaceae cyanobacterium CENA369]|uniref:Uncharacterized protein n=1 Tax=Dendronalium phyllosphericum CENA369 TaxID=1725256 RepID=A0A8J7I242_9NOST|nr:hypothetical protein [Dendronalium phyllosphericum]MBH8573265.1 hypothetical protein [Dendronalium phyllosphericum CENA369]
MARARKALQQAEIPFHRTRVGDIFVEIKPNKALVKSFMSDSHHFFDFVLFACLLLRLLAEVGKRGKGLLFSL